MNSGEKCCYNLDRAAIAEDKKPDTLLWVQEFVRRLPFTQRNFFSDSDVSNLSGCVARYDTITTSAVYEPWRHVGTSRSEVVAEFCAFLDRDVDSRWAFKDTREKWYPAGGVGRHGTA